MLFTSSQTPAEGFRFRLTRRPYGMSTLDVTRVELFIGSVGGAGWVLGEGGDWGWVGGASGKGSRWNKSVTWNPFILV